MKIPPWMMVALSLASCDGCQERTPDVCCTSDSECAQLGLPPGSVSDYGCGQGHVCRDFYCIPEEAPDAGELDAAMDAPIDAPTRRCDPSAPFGTPAPVPNVNSLYEELAMSMTLDELTAFFVRHDGTSFVLEMSTRMSSHAEFPTPAATPTIAAIASYPGFEQRPSPTSDGLILYFMRDSTVSAAHRPNTNEVFTSGTPVYVDGAPLTAAISPKISSDSATLYWVLPSDKLRAASRSSTYDVFVSGRIMSTVNLTDFAISADELTLYYSDFPNADVFVSTRMSRDVPFGVGAPLANVSTTAPDVPMLVTADECLLYIRSSRTGSLGSNDFWVARRSQ